MSRDDYYDDEDDFGDDLYEEDEFGADDGFTEIDPDEEEETFAAEEQPSPQQGEQDIDQILGEMAGGGEQGEDDLAWRETYFVLFQRHQRPTLTQVEAAINDAGGRLTIEHLQADEDGFFQSVLIQAPEDNAALEVSYEHGEAVMEQSAELAKHLQKQIDSEVLAQLLRADARLDVMHFERIDDPAPLSEESEDELAIEALNPATLISVVEALASLTGGVPIDPSAGEIMI